jgi:hypothetical protein
MKLWREKRGGARGSDWKTKVAITLCQRLLEMICVYEMKPNSWWKVVKMVAPIMMNPWANHPSWRMPWWWRRCSPTRLLFGGIWMELYELEVGERVQDESWIYSKSLKRRQTRYHACSVAGIMGCVFGGGYHGVRLWWRIPWVACLVADTKGCVFDGGYHELRVWWWILWVAL